MKGLYCFWESDAAAPPLILDNWWGHVHPQKAHLPVLHQLYMGWEWQNSNKNLSASLKNGMMEIEFNSWRCYFFQLTGRTQAKNFIQLSFSGQMTCVHLKLNQNCPDRLRSLKGFKREEEVPYCLAICSAFKIKLYTPYFKFIWISSSALGPFKFTWTEACSSKS